jgi:hypothetical protein
MALSSTTSRARSGRCCGATSGFAWYFPVAELEGRYLRVVTLEDKVTIHNAFPDRGFKP